MEVLSKQINIKETEDKTAEINNSSKSHNPGLRALLSIKNFTATLKKDYSELLQIESQLDDVNKNGLLIIEANTSPEATARWKAVLPELIIAVSAINNTLIAAKGKIDRKEKDGYPDLRKQLEVHITELKDNYKNAENIGFKVLPEAVHPQWEKEFVQLEKTLLVSLVKHVASCRVLLQMIERYTPDELNRITQIIVDHIPLDFTYEEAVEYQNDYYRALTNFKNEFKEEKNLWDKFLDILAGGTHQSPSERVMMERWLDGEKGDL